MKRLLGAGESYVGGSVAWDFRRILRLLRKLKHSIYVGYYWSINSFYVWVERNKWCHILRTRYTRTRVILNVFSTLM